MAERLRQCGQPTRNESPTCCRAKPSSKRRRAITRASSPCWLRTGSTPCDGGRAPRCGPRPADLSRRSRPTPRTARGRARAQRRCRHGRKAVAVEAARPIPRASRRRARRPCSASGPPPPHASRLGRQRPCGGPADRSRTAARRSPREADSAAPLARRRGGRPFGARTPPIRRRPPYPAAGGRCGGRHPGRHRDAHAGQARSRGRASHAGPGGPGRAARRNRGAARAARQQLDARTLEAQASLLLHRTLAAAQRESKDRWLGPVRDRVRALPALIQPDSEIVLNERTFAIEHLVRAGVPEPFEP